jgi:hypothetical protein
VALRFSIALRSALSIYHNIYYAIVTQAGNTDLAADIEGAGRARNLDRLRLGGDGRRGFRLIFDTSNRQGIDHKHESALEKRRGTTFGVRLAGSGQAAGS